MALDPSRIFSGLDHGHGLIAAVSGGSDSLALLFLLNDRFAGTGTRLVAVTVDHGLRAGAADEARAVASVCHALGVEHRTLAWQGEKPRTGLIAAAREARYDLLARAARAFGAGIVLTGHTMDDQAETVAMRAARGEGGGLAGMARTTLFDGDLWIARPLLGRRRQALRDHLAERGQPWIDDPTNEDAAYERVRVRGSLGDGDVEALAATARAEGERRAALSGAAAALVARFVRRAAPGLFRLDPEMLDVGDAAVHALRALLAVAGGTPRLPDLERVRALHQRLRAHEGRHPLRATLSRAVVDARRQDIWVRREARNVPATPLCGARQPWDGRWLVEGPRGLTLAPVGSERAKALAPVLPDVPQSLSRLAFSLEPAAFSNGVFVALAAGPDAAAQGVTARPVAAPFSRFLPEFDLPLAAALLRLIGAPELPSPPWKHHIEAKA